MLKFRAAAVVGLLVMCTDLADAQSVPDHKIEKRDGSCAITILPVTTFGVSPPQLRILVGRDKRITIAPVADAAMQRIELVSGNKRETAAPEAHTTTASLTSGRLLTMAGSTARKNAPFFLTGRDGAGAYHSARYEALQPSGIVRILEDSGCFAREKTESELAAAERALGLSEEERLHIRWVLFDAGKAPGSPGNSTVFSEADRARLRTYTMSIGLPPQRYLDLALANRLVDRKLLPRRVNEGSIGRSTRSFQSWWFREKEGTYCEISSSADAVSGEDFWEFPRMLFSVERSKPDNSMFIDMVSPNPFRSTAPVIAFVDGARFELQVKNDGVLPRAVGDGNLDSGVIKAILNGSFVEIRGQSKRTGNEISVSFGGRGFTAAFLRMMDICRKPKLQDWLK